MGGPRKLHKKFEKPRHPWDSANLERESAIRKKYGLKTKREIWRSETVLRRFRRQARSLQPLKGPAAEKQKAELIRRLMSLNLVKEGASLDDVLSVSLDDVLNRRLDAIVYMKGLASTPKQARQFIKHGHIVIKNKAVTVPSYMVLAEEEGFIGHRKGSTVHEIVVARAPEEPGARGQKEG